MMIGILKPTHMQAISRLWRGGQTKRVNIFHLLMDNDIERRVHERSEAKIQLQTWFDKQVRTEANGITVCRISRRWSFAYTLVL